MSVTPKCSEALVGLFAHSKRQILQITMVRGRDHCDCTGFEQAVNSARVISWCIDMFDNLKTQNHRKRPKAVSQNVISGIEIDTQLRVRVIRLLNALS